MPITVAARSKAWVWGRSLSGITGSNHAVGMYIYLSVVRTVFCQVEVSATGRFLVQRGTTECSESECYREASIMGRP